MAKKLIVFLIEAIMMISIFGFAGCNEVNEIYELKQGYYATDDKTASIELYGDSSFSFNIESTAGNYSIDGSKLLLHYTDDYELVFNIGESQIVFAGANINGKFAKEGPTSVGTVFKKTFLETETVDMVDCSYFLYHVTTSWIGDRIRLSHPNENNAFYCSVAKGSFSYEQEEKEKTVQANKAFYWVPYQWDADGQKSKLEAEKVYVDIVLKEDIHIIGYAVIEIYPMDEYGQGYMAKTLKAVLFPKFDGKYQEVQQEDVNQLFEEIKNN